MFKTSIIKNTTESRLFKHRDEKRERKSMMQLCDFTDRLGFDDAFRAKLTPYWPGDPDLSVPAGWEDSANSGLDIVRYMDFSPFSYI